MAFQGEWFLDPLHAMTTTKPVLIRDNTLKALIQEKLHAFSVQTAQRLQKSEQPQAAAVALAIIGEGYGADLPNFPRHDAWSNQAAVLLTRRSLHLRKHAGQWALPGGRIDAGETAEQAALSEMAEEVNLNLDASAIMGRLDDFVKPASRIFRGTVRFRSARQNFS